MLLFLFCPQPSASQEHFFFKLFNPPLPSRNPEITGILWPITIVTQPADILDCENHVVSFKVVISGGMVPVTYTWQRQRPAEGSFTDIPPGAPGISYPSPGTLRVANVGGNENPSLTRYRVVITDPGGSITSNAALLTVNEITDIIPSTAFPSKTLVILCEGADFSYTLTTSGSPPVSFQWKKYVSSGVWVNVTDNGVISGSQSAVLTFTGATVAESGEYKVNITFHSSGADCQVESAGRTRVLTIQAVPEGPFITEPLPACSGMAPEPLLALPPEGGSGNFTFQWQESPDGSTWVNIPGATTLTYQPPPLVTPAWYRITATDGGIVTCGNTISLPVLQSVEDCNNRHYRTVKDGPWNDRTVWETSPDAVTWGGTAYTFPTAAMRTITIRNGHTIMVDQHVTVDEVTVEAGGAVTIAAGVTLTNSGGDDDFILNSSPACYGSLLDLGTFSGSLQYRLYTDPSRWTIISPPVKVTSGFGTNSSAINFDAGYNEYDFGWYQELGNEGWQYYSVLPSGLTSGRGYVVCSADTNTPGEGVITFAGTPNGMVNDTVSPVVCESSARHGWNGVGNPFTSAIGATTQALSAENFLTVNADIFEDTYAAIYLWNQTGPYDGTQQYYKAIGNSGYNYAGFSYYGGSDPDYLQAGQGFLINVKENTKAVFTKAMQCHAPDVVLKSAGKGWYGLTLVAAAGKRIRTAVIAFHGKMTRGLDKTYDVGLLPSDRFCLYSRLVEGDAGADLEIQCLPENQYDQLQIPIGLDLPEGGEVIIKAAGVFLPEGWIPLLEDRLQQISVPLQSGADSFRVMVPANTCDTGRFWLRFIDSTTAAKSTKHAAAESSKQSAGFSAWYENGKIFLKGKFPNEAMVELYDLQGRKVGIGVLQQPGLHQIPVNGLPGGIYFLQIWGKEGREVLKVRVLGE